MHSDKYYKLLDGSGRHKLLEAAWSKRLLPRVALLPLAQVQFLLP